MAYPVSQSTIITRALQRTNLEGATQFITPTELTDMCNVSIAKWYDEVRGSTWNGGYFRSTFTITTTANTNNQNTNPPSNAIYALPADFLSAISVDAFISPSLVITCKPFQEEERNWYRFWLGAVGWFLGTTVKYQIQGGGNNGTPYIVFLPPPQAAIPIQVNYIPIAPQLSAPDDTIDCINGWEEFIVLNMALMLLLKCGRTEEMPIYSAMLEEQRQRIRTQAPRRDMECAEKVHELNADLDGWLF